MQLSFNTNGMTQEQVNLIQPAVSALLAEAGITHSGVHCVDGVCTIDSPSAELSISQGDLESKLAAQAAEREAAEAADRAAHPDEYA